NPHAQGYNARFGILLDMVGGKNTVFLKESYSEQFAPDINKKVWKAAKKLGYARIFIDEDGGGVTDDHLFINRLARIKTIDIIASDPEGGFTPTWHTLTDNMEHIDKNTLKAVGQTVLEVIYNEK
ncbi:M28 family peptidase, partial [Bacteroides acidifaciens]